MAGDAPLVAAAALAARGWPVFPVGRNKRPRLKRWPEVATTDPAQIHSWWTREHAGAGVGVLCGGRSGIVVVDVDPRHDGEAGLSALETRYGVLPRTLSARTGGGGRHLYFLQPRGVLIRNKTALDGVPGVDVRGDGGYVVAPPSLHESGGRYEWIQENERLGRLPCAWIDLLGDVRPTTDAAPAASPIRSQLRPSTVDFLAFGAARGTRNDYLFKAAANMAVCGWSLDNARPRLLAGCAACVPPYNDTRAADATIASAFRSVRARTASDVAPSNHDGRSVARAAALRSTHPASPPVRPWTPFPTQCLPGPLRSFIDECAAAIGCDPAMVALPALAVVAAVIGTTRRIRLKRTWHEPAILWSVIIAESGELKSPALDQARSVIDRIQARAFEEYDEADGDYETARLRYEADLKMWMSRRGERGDPPVRPTPPVCTRILVEDVTIEGIAPILRDNPRGALLCRDELSGWLGSFDNYHANRGGDVARWLELHRGGSLLVDRKTGRERTVFVPRAACSVTGTVQPATLRRALGREHLDNGLAARMLLAMPPRRHKSWSDSELSPETAAAFERVIDRLYALQSGADAERRVAPVDMCLTAEGKDAWVEFYNQFGREQAAVTGDLAKAFAKLEGYAARLALLVHLLRWAAGEKCDPDNIDADSISAGAGLSLWFCNECERVYAVLPESAGDRANRELAAWIEARGGTVTTRDLTHGLRRFRENGEAARAALDELVGAGLGRWCEPGHGAKGGRPTERFVLVTNVTVTETPSDSVTNGGFGDGDSGDASALTGSSNSSAAAQESGADQPEGTDRTLAEDFKIAQEVLAEAVPEPGSLHLDVGR